MLNPPAVTLNSHKETIDSMNMVHLKQGFGKRNRIGNIRTSYDVSLCYPYIM